MARTGRPPKPVEEHKRHGTYRADRHGSRSGGEVVPLPMAEGTPEPPADLGIEGRKLWARAWDAAITWLSPKSDMQAVEQACRLADDLATARELYRVSRDPKHAKTVVDFSKQLAEALSGLGFTPTARTRLGVAEVKRVSALQALRNQQG